MSRSRLFSAVQRDHDLAWELVNRLTGGKEEPAHGRAERHRIAQELIALESTHEVAEELVVWPAVRAHCPGGDDLAGTALLQEAQAKLVLNELRHLSGSSEEFSECANAVAAHFRDHMSYEENQVWPRLEDHMGREDLDRMAGRYLAARESGPTRPHPLTPSTPEVLRTAGAVVARLDRMRDRVLSRKVPGQ